MSERNIPVRIMLTRDEWTVFDAIATRHKLTCISDAIEEVLENTVTRAIEEIENEADGD